MIIVGQYSDRATLICEVTPETWCKRLPHALKVFSGKPERFYTPGRDINLLPWQQCHKSPWSHLSQWQMPHWFISGRFLEAVKISSSEFWDHIVLQMENGTTDLWIQGFIDWVGTGPGSAVQCGVAELFWGPSLVLVLLDFPPLCQTYTAVVQQFGIAQTCCSHVGDDPRLVSLRNNPCHVVAFCSGPPWGGP